MSKNGSRTWGRALCAAGLLALLPATPSWSQPSTIDDVVLVARQELRLEPYVTQAAGHIVVNDPGGRALISQRFRTVPDFAPQFVADQILVTELLYSGPLFFDLFTNTLTDPSAHTVIGGTMTQPIGVSLPLLPYPAPVAVTPGATNVIVKRTTSPVTLPPGDYGDIRVRAGGAILFTGGTYNIRSLRGGSRSIVLFNGATTVNVANRVRFARRSVVGPADPAMNGRCVTINIAGVARSRLGRLAEVNAIINAPLANVRVAQFASFRGTLTADKISVGRAALIQTLPPLTEPCP